MGLGVSDVCYVSMQSTAVDFRRLWWDKDGRSPSSAPACPCGAPIPPAGYVSLGSRFLHAEPCSFFAL